jgi:hypothetical protein
MLADLARTWGAVAPSQVLSSVRRVAGQMQPALRHCEAATTFAFTKTAVPTTTALSTDGDADPISAKLAADVCGFLVSACDLDPEFRIKARNLLLGESTTLQIPPASPTTVPAAAIETQLSLPND